MYKDKISVAGTATDEAKLADAIAAADVQLNKVTADTIINAYATAVDGTTNDLSATEPVYKAVKDAKTALTSAKAGTDVASIEAKTLALKNAIIAVETATTELVTKTTAVRAAVVTNTEAALKAALAEFAGYDASNSAAYFAVKGDFASVATRTAVEDAITAVNTAQTKIATAESLLGNITLTDTTALKTKLDAISGMTATGVTLAVKEEVTGPAEAKTAKIEAGTGAVTLGTTQQVLDVVITITLTKGITVEKTIAVTVPAAL